VTNRIQLLLDVEYPVVQAPMTYIARAELAAAVSEGGGLGMIETLTAEGRADLHRVRELTDRPVAANLMILGWKRDPSIVDELVAAEVRHVFTSAGDPALFTARLHDAGMTVIHVVGSLKGAMKAVDAGVDALVVEGVEGGGFKSALGASTLVLLPLVASRVDLPIIAAGGICDARSAGAAVVLGAEGVQMGTRMLASHEAAVHANFKNAIMSAGDDGTVMLDLPGNPTMRVLRTGLAARTAAADPNVQLLGRITDLYFEGDMDASVANTGQVSSRITDLQPGFPHRQANLVRDRKRLARGELSAWRPLLVQSLVSEERFERCGALVRQHSPTHLRPVRQPPVAHHVPQRADRPRLRLPCAEHQPRHPCHHQRACTHRAWLDRHRQSRAFQPPAVAQHRRRGAHRQDLGMRGRITEFLAHVGRPRQFCAVRGHDHRPDRHVARACVTCGVECGPDQVLVAAHRPKRSSTADNSSAKPISRAIRPNCSSA
jgi:enoyl-[acyl-carrier protein] reductase II